MICKFPNLEAERVRRGMTKKDLYEKMGVSKTTYWGWQKGIHDLPVSRIIEIADEFGCSVDYLIGR